MFCEAQLISFYIRRSSLCLKFSREKNLRANFNILELQSSVIKATVRHENIKQTSY